MASSTPGWDFLDSGAGVYFHIHTFLNGRICLTGKNLCEGSENTEQYGQSLPAQLTVRWASALPFLLQDTWPEPYLTELGGPSVRGLIFTERPVCLTVPGAHRSVMVTPQSCLGLGCGYCLHLHTGTEDLTDYFRLQIIHPCRGRFGAQTQVCTVLGTVVLPAETKEGAYKNSVLLTRLAVLVCHL